MLREVGQQEEIGTPLSAVVDHQSLRHCAQVFIDTMNRLSSEVENNFWLKQDGSVVSHFEQQIEQVVGDYLRRTTPFISVIGEEGYSYQVQGSRLTWLIDPIDGSISFKSGLDSYSFVATLIKETDDGTETPVAAMIVLPEKNNKIFTAVKDEGVQRNGRYLPSIRELPEPHHKSIICRSDSYTFSMAGRSEWREKLDKLDGDKSSLGICRTITDMHAHTLVAEGICALKVDAACADWDRYPAELLVREAGGMSIFIPCKNPDRDLSGSLIVGHPRLVQQIAELLGVEA